ncbi:transcription antiterminator [Streptococcus sp. H31]|uniref:BglG family transcription antiterminator n=1 Tax=Streptococcus huangxiaojuni TaxID=3237239 RepID=UPI0034A20EF6
MLLTQRQKQVLDILESQNDFITAAQLAKMCGVSQRTVFSDLEKIEKHIQQSGQYFERRRGVGIAVRNLKEPLSVKEDTVEWDVYDIVTRRIEIMRMLLFDEKRVSFNSLSDQFLVSKTSITRDFDVIMKILSVNSDIKLQKDSHGTQLVGSENDIQKAYLQFNRYIISNSDHYLNDSVQKKVSCLEKYYGEKVVKVATSILYSYVRENINAISDYYVQNVLSIFIILLYRLLNGHHLQTEEEYISDHQTSFYRESAVKLLHKASLRLKFSYSNADVSYLSNQLISNRFEEINTDVVNNDLVSDIIEQISHALNVNFEQDRQLVKQLGQHISAMIYRLKTKNTIENPFTDQVKVEFSMTFNTIWLVLSRYEEQLGIAFNEDEIAFLTIYFQAAFERIKMNKKILIVCEMGIATSELLLNRIKNNIPSFDAIEISSVEELAHLDLSDFDLIISTVDIDIAAENVVQVSPFLTQKDIEAIKEAGYIPSSTAQSAEKPALTSLKKRLSDRLIFVDTSFSTKKDVLDKIGQCMLKADIVTEPFIENLHQREKIGGTDLPQGVAVPHGYPKNVNETYVVIIKNQKKIKWKRYYVDLIFIVCIATKDTGEARALLADIYHLIDEPERLKKLRLSKTAKELYQAVGGE